MNKYILNKVIIKNFKLFGGEPYTVTFGNDRFVVLDGPNGYGKTSVFDAIELAITGTIERLYPVENRQVPSDVVIAHKGSSDVEIRIELCGDEPMTIVRRLKKKLPSRATRIDKFSDLWKLYNVVGEEEKEISNEELHSILHNAHISRDYHLFHYVRQEDTAHFLKSKKEHQRAEALTELFGDTKEAEKNRDQLDAISKKIAGIIKRLAVDKKELEERYQLSANQVMHSTDSQDAHQFLLPWMQDKPAAPEWDKEVIHDLTPEKRDKILEEIDQIKALVTYRETFLAERIYRKSAQEEKVLRLFVLYYRSLDRIEELRAKVKQSRIIASALKHLTIDQIDKIEENSELLELFAMIGYKEKDLFFTRLQEVVAARKRNHGNSQLYTELIRYRDEIEKRLREMGDKDTCPLCGFHYETDDALFQAIMERGDYYKALLSDEGKKVLTLQTSFETEILKPLVERLSHFKEQLNAPTPEVISELESALKIKERLDKLEKWLISENILFSDICIEYSPIVLPEPECEKRYQLLAERIRAKSLTLSAKYSEANAVGTFERLFRDYFELNAEYLNRTTLEAIDLKSSYIRSRYFNSLASITEKHRILEYNINQLMNKNEKIKRVKEIVQKEIRSYQKKLITDIEIPFYIYSGKILQTHQAGLGNGIFIKDPTGSDELKNVRLVSDWRSDHDILNTMSSGQIAAVVIALTLTLNKVYAKGLNTILIDDPTQTMDDINIVSLAEILRNEFSDRQIILSTHEEDVSRYLLYKFLKHGHSVRKINLMERKEYRLNN